MSIESERRWKMGGGATVLLVVVVPLFYEFSSNGFTAWNAFLAVILAGLAVAVISLQRYLMAHVDEVGEARFDTRNKSEIDG